MRNAIVKYQAKSNANFVMGYALTFVNIHLMYHIIIILQKKGWKRIFSYDKMTSDIKEIRYLHPWEYDGLILIRFCKVDYENLRNPI